MPPGHGGPLCPERVARLQDLNPISSSATAAGAKRFRCARFFPRPGSPSIANSIIGRKVRTSILIPRDRSSGSTGSSRCIARTPALCCRSPRPISACRPTEWQKQTYPPEHQAKIHVVHEGVDEIRLRPDPKARFLLPEWRNPQSRPGSRDLRRPQSRTDARLPHFHARPAENSLRPPRSARSSSSAAMAFPTAPPRPKGRAGNRSISTKSPIGWTSRASISCPRFPMTIMSPCFRFRGRMSI